jgi:transcriptional regulator with XRE-family HTH domain
MAIKSQIAIRSKTLGLLIRDARTTARRSTIECAQAIGVKPGIFRAYEDGRRGPSLPEMEALVYFLDLPIDHFWSKEIKSDKPLRHETIDLSRVLSVRQRKIGALLRQERMTASISLTHLSHETGISSARIKSYELGERPIPLPELEALVKALGGRIESFFDRTGPIGQWLMSEEAIRDFLELPLELRQFVAVPVNRPYLELAMKLSNMSKDKLRSVAEDLLDITF